MKLIDGKSQSLEINKNLLSFYNRLKSEFSLTRKPKVSIVTLNENDDSLLYVNQKMNTIKSMGFDCEVKELPIDSMNNDVVKILHDLNNDDSVDAIILQMPLPFHLNFETLVSAISPKKDIDGLNSINRGMLTSNDSFGVYSFSDVSNLNKLTDDEFKKHILEIKNNNLSKIGISQPLIPCTPLGVVYLLDQEFESIENKNIVLLGKSNIVGRPLISLLLNKGANVSVLHSKTTQESGEVYISNADIVITAVGRSLLFGDLFKNSTKSNVCIIDVGINFIRNDNGKNILYGDVHVDSLVELEDKKDITFSVTPVPGGVGPMTVSAVVLNLILIYTRNQLSNID